MDGGAWWPTVHGVAQSRTQLKWLSSSSSRESVGHGDQSHPLTVHEGQVADSSNMDAVTRLPSFRVSLSPLLHPLSCLS